MANCYKVVESKARRKHFSGISNAFHAVIARLIRTKRILLYGALQRRVVLLQIIVPIIDAVNECTS